MKNKFLVIGTASFLSAVFVACGATSEVNQSVAELSETVSPLAGAPEGATLVQEGQVTVQVARKMLTLNGASDGFVFAAAVGKAAKGDANNFDILLVDTQKSLSSRDFDTMKSAVKNQKTLVLDARADGSGRQNVAEALKKITGGSSIQNADAVMVEYEEGVGYLVAPINTARQGLQLQDADSSFTASNSVENVLGL